MSRDRKEKETAPLATVRAEVEQLLQQERLEPGDEWFVVAVSWWERVFPSKTMDEDDEHDISNGHADDEDVEDALQMVRNEELVDLTVSSKERKAIVLKPMLAEGQDYRLVSEPVWNRLSHTFGFDWEIPRAVVTRGPAQRLVVEVYPIVFQLLLWRNGLDEPEPVLDASGMPLVVVASESCRLDELQQRIWKDMIGNVKMYFPNLAPTDVQQNVQVCYRVADPAPWTPLNEAVVPEERGGFPSSSNGYSQILVEGTSVGELQLEERDVQQGLERFHSLLVEERFQVTENAEWDWRCRKFYSEIQANAWRYALEINQLVDALDTDKKWYESRITEMDEHRVKVHYRGWSSKWDEWIDRMSPRLAPLHTNVRNWRIFQVNDRLQVGTIVPHKTFPVWRNATVDAVEKSEMDDTLKIQISIDGTKDTRWLDAQDELLCPPGTHKAANTVATAVYSPPTTSLYSSSSFSRYNDRGRDYSYDYGRGKPEFKGVVGLQNLGNTCFMNSMLQCLINTPPLKEYFLRIHDSTHRPSFESDINEDNPLGMKGRIAIEFAALVRRMWGGEYTVVSPKGLKSVIGQYAPQFAGYQQQDSQEVMNFLLDGLHEDLNRVKAKPYTTPVERNGRGDFEVAKEEWEQYLRRNDSIIVENFMGQLRSHVTCSNPNCGNESVTFDPFMNLSVPIPNAETVLLQVQLFWANGDIPMKYAVRVQKDGSTLRDVKEQLSELSGVPFSRLFFVEVWRHRIRKAYNDAILIEDLREDILHAYELDLPVTEYEFSTPNVRPPAAMKMALKDNDNAMDKAMQLVPLLHVAPSASPIDSRSTTDGYDFQDDDGYGPKQRRVEVELFNTPLLVSIDRNTSKAEVHQKVWRTVQRLVSTEAMETTFGCGDDQGLPYRLHMTQPDGTTLLRDVSRADEPFELPELDGKPYTITLEWSRNGYRDGYDQSSAKRIALHESMKSLRISTPTEDITLLNCLAKFTEREQLGKTDTWYCPKCKNHVRAFKKFDLFALPKVLIFHLKRFRYAQSSFYMHRDKITTLVNFPTEGLDLSKYVVGPQQGTPLVYDLYAVSEHSGGLGGGHYTAVAKNPENGHWFSFNDSFTNETVPEKAVTPRAYVLFYIRRDEI